jgi:acyl-[acyl-carrier-protein]-phospholipid O-acyltransferase/long-chain-fatty-acid--[acyl-carrier-protein] ligase
MSPERPSFEEAAQHSAHDHRTLGAAFIRQAKRGPRKLAVVDARGRMSRLRLAAVALTLIPVLDLEPDEERVGIVLPPGVGGVLVNLAISFSGRCVVNLNHTTGEAQLARMCRLAGLRSIVSSRQYLARIEDPKLPGRLILAEDLIPRLPKARVLFNMLRVLLWPAARLDRARAGQIAAIVFSSGTTGDPKGVQLTHRQILFNCDAVLQHIDIREDRDILACPLPLFHSFGLIPGTWMGLIAGVTLVQQADPRDGRALGKLIQETGATILLSTPTFVRGYMRRIEPEQLASLRFAVVGAERCPAELKAEFRERYGAELLEGYGCTELAPAGALNTPDAQRQGSIGRPLPGVEFHAADPDTREPLPAGSEGLLIVRSPGRMLGYLDRPDLTERAFIHGGYDSGDIGHVDADGYVFLTGRLARFAKIGGEMVPLDRVEEAIQSWLNAHYGPEEAEAVAVAAVPSARRGERIVLLYTQLPCAPEEILAGLADLPPLFKPKANDFHAVETIPVLGTGKRDLGRIKALAEAVARGDADD